MADKKKQVHFLLDADIYEQYKALLKDLGTLPSYDMTAYITECVSGKQTAIERKYDEKRKGRK